MDTLQNKNSYNETVSDIAQAIQQECHQSVEYIIKATDKPVSYQDATNVFLFRKLAELQEQVNYLNGLVSIR